MALVGSERLDMNGKPRSRGKPASALCQISSAQALPSGERRGIVLKHPPGWGALPGLVHLKVSFAMPQVMRASSCTNSFAVGTLSWTAVQNAQLAAMLSGA
jgi:hypothetical protein